MKTKTLFFISVLLLSFAACSDDDDNSGLSSLVVNDAFDTSLQEWTGDFADYPTGATDSVFYELNFGLVTLPEPLDQTKKGMMISGNNHSDDLFMFVKKRVSGLKPNQNYKVTFEIELASDAASNWFGVGGSPGESVYLGVGLTGEEPQKENNRQEGYYRMNVKKINQSQDGEEMKVIGNIANGKDLDEYTLIKRTGNIQGKTNDKGEAWIIVGTDSGFEATTTLYYTRIQAAFELVE